MKNLSEMSSQELEELLKKKKAEEHEAAMQRRAAYEGIRAELAHDVMQKVLMVSADAKDFAKYCNDQYTAFRETMEEYGQLKSATQMGFTLCVNDFKWEVKRNKVKRFDERADVAAARLIEFLRDWIKNQKDGTENPMYQLAMTLLERNKYGDLDYKSVSKLYDLEQRFNSEEYSSIMQLFKESNAVEATAVNHYFYQRDKDGVWRKIEPSVNMF
jgi:hypothetical protein